MASQAPVLSHTPRTALRVAAATLPHSPAPPLPCATFEFMAFESEKVMFEIYREKTYTGKYRVVYYTELQDHERDWEISRAMAGESFYDGFLKNYRLDEGKQVIAQFIERLNQGERVDPADVGAALHDYAAT